MSNISDVLARVTVLSASVTAVTSGIQHLKDLIQALKDALAQGQDTQPIIDAINAEISRLDALASDANSQS